MYTMYMALHIANPEVEQKVREMASITGESITEAIGAAAEERIARIGPVRKQRRAPTAGEILDLVRSFKLQRVNRDLTEDEILGYGADGHCV